MPQVAGLGGWRMKFSSEHSGRDDTPEQLDTSFKDEHSLQLVITRQPPSTEQAWHPCHARTNNQAATRLQHAVHDVFSVPR